MIYSEDFQDESRVLSTWQYSDEDRDGFIWELVWGSDDYTLPAGFGGNTNVMFGSTGYSTMPGNTGPADADNLLISPMIDLPAGKTLTLEYKIGNYLSYMDKNNYQLFVIEEGQNWYPTLTPVVQKVFTGTSKAQNETVDISAFQGKRVQLFFRHYNSFFQWYMLLDDVKITATEALSTTDNQKGNLSVSPNPVSDILHLSGFSKIESYSIFDASGKAVLTGKADQVNVSALTSGLYIIVVRDSEAVNSFKFIKK